MSVLALINAQKAFYRNGTWRVADPALESRLNEATEMWIRDTGGPRLSDPDPELSCAEHIALQFGGRVVRHVPARRSGHMRDMFISRRQMSLF